MLSPSLKLQRLRGIFVVYFVLKSIAGAVVAFHVLRPVAGHYGLRGWSPGGLAVFSLTVTAAVLAAALLVFARLLELRNWARVLLLVVGWLAVSGAFFGLLIAAPGPEMSSWLRRLLPGLNLDWQKLIQFDRVQKTFELLFWGYAIAVLQLDPAVRDEFCPRPPEGDGPAPG
jgi:hypothetical protein